MALPKQTTKFKCVLVTYNDAEDGDWWHCQNGQPYCLPVNHSYILMLCLLLHVRLSEQHTTPCFDGRFTLVFIPNIEVVRLCDNVNRALGLHRALSHVLHASRRISRRPTDNVASINVTGL